MLRLRQGAKLQAQLLRSLRSGTFSDSCDETCAKPHTCLRALAHLH